MGKRVQAIVEGPVLAWARESAGLTILDAARFLKKEPDLVRSWERGEAKPYMGQLRKLAGFYKRPISDFYLPAPPEERPLPHDFRRSPGTVAGTWSPALRQQLRFARERQELTIHLREDMGDPLPRFGTRVSQSQSPEQVGERIRDVLGVDMVEQSGWKDAYAALRAWRQRIETLDVLVFQFDQVEVPEAWGFSIVDTVYPVIGINKRLAPNGRSFTLMHEFVHLLLGEGGICDIDDFSPRGARELAVEVFCNHSAAAALMPSAEFCSHPLIGPRFETTATDWQDHEINTLAKYFSVSREAVVRRLLTFDLTTPEFYQAKRAAYHAQIRANRERQRQANKDKPFGGQNRAQRAISDFGGNFVRIVLDSFGDGRITLADTARYLEVQANRIPKVQELAMRS